MRVRRAELRDIVGLTGMFTMLLDQLKAQGQELLADNSAESDNGVVGFLLSKMGTEENIVLVSVDDHDWPAGFLVGWVLDYPLFYRHRRVAELQYLYPLSFEQTPRLLKEFEKWGREMGATGTSNYATPGNEPSIRCMERDGRTLSYYHYFKPYEVT